MVKVAHIPVPNGIAVQANTTSRKPAVQTCTVGESNKFALTHTAMVGSRFCFFNIISKQTLVLTFFCPFFFSVKQHTTTTILLSQFRWAKDSTSLSVPEVFQAVYWKQTFRHLQRVPNLLQRYVMFSHCLFYFWFLIMFVKFFFLFFFFLFFFFFSILSGVMDFFKHSWQRLASLAVVFSSGFFSYDLVFELSWGRYTIRNISWTNTKTLTTNHPPKMDIPLRSLSYQLFSLFRETLLHLRSPIFLARNIREYPGKPKILGWKPSLPTKRIYKNSSSRTWNSWPHDVDILYTRS